MADEGFHIVISGISGRLPESSNIEEFKQQLFDGVDLVTADSRRWPCGLYGLPTRNGKLKDITQFDASFFGVHPKQAHAMDPSIRLLLEVTYEAMIDAGVNPAEFRGSNTGVFVGSAQSESQEYWTRDKNRINGYEFLGGCRNMLANRISYVFDFNGPSFAIDAACSSSFAALQEAFDAIRFGKCDAAIVGGVNILLNPNTSLQLQKLGTLSPEGRCSSFDSSAAGYVRSEAVVVLFLQKYSKANRMYATILGAKTNTDGNKKDGISFPSGRMQKKLIEEVYEEAGIDPADVMYVEAHGTGTKAGDPQEVNAIVDVFCKTNKKRPLKIGSVKSNMGHAEASSGLCSVVKVILAMESGTIPGNLHYNRPNTNIPGLRDGRLKVVTINENFNGGIVGLNSFGLGGTNVHVILSSNPKLQIPSSQNKIPRLLIVSGRTNYAVDYFLKKIKEQPSRELCALIYNIHKMNIKGHNYRGFCLLEDDTVQEIGKANETPPIWFVFSGMGSQWMGMGKALMNLEPLSKSIIRAANTLKPYGIDLINIICDDSNTDLNNVLNSFISITSIQIALVDFLSLLGIEPDGMIGHSIGEIACAYADKTITFEQAILIAYARGNALLECKLPIGAMAAVGLSWEECKIRIPSDIFIACHNNKDNVTISGLPESINKFTKKLIAEGIFAKAVDTSGFAFHSKYISKAGPKFGIALQSLLPTPKARSSKWISSSIRESAWNTPLAQTSSSAYHTNNLLSPVYFYEATKYIPSNAIVLEIAPHSLLQSILKSSLGKNVTNIGLLKKDHPDNIKFLLSNIGKFYMSGGQPNIAAIYPSVTFPVGKGTPMLASMVKWDHSVDWATPNYSDTGSKLGELITEIDLSKEEYIFLKDHIIDGRIIFPASGYIVLIWKTFAELINQDFEKLPVILEDVKFLRATIMPPEGSVKFLINIFKFTGEFKICEGGSVVVSGRILTRDNIKDQFLNLPFKMKSNNNCILSLNKSDCYKELGLSGYGNDGCFKGILHADDLVTTGILEWKNNWITFIDTILQFYFLGKNTRDLYVPTKIDEILIDPQTQIELNLDQIPVYFDRNIGVINSGSIELRRIKGGFVFRHQQTKNIPKLETYQFIPFENITPPLKRNEISILNTLSIATQLVIENSPNITKLKVIEIVTDNQTNIYMLPKVQEIIETEPNVNIVGTIITSKTINTDTFKETSIEALPIPVSMESADLVIISNVLVNEKNEDIANALLLLKCGGFILLEEPKSISELKLFHNHSLEVIYKQVIGNKIYILARMSVKIPDNPKIIEITESSYNWVDPLKQAIHLSETTDDKIYIVCNEELSGIVGLVNCIRKEPGGKNVRCVFIHDTNLKDFSLSSNFYTKQLQKDLVHNVYENGIWGTFRYLPFQQDDSNHLKNEVEHAYINTITRSDLYSLKWIESPLKFCKENSNICNVYYAPLNFRDVMLATGKLSSDNMPKNLAQQDSLFGLEFSGVNVKGKRVMGIVAAGGLATTVLSDPDLLWEVPKDWSLKEAATIPVAYGTSYYALIIRGNMQQGETILIHAGAGSVGLASISISLNMGCIVYTTVGSESKKAFLKKTFPQLTDDHIGYSRDANFEYWILSQTKGRGVDLVLNSLAGKQLQASVRCLAHGGRFLEIGKVDLSNDSPLGMALFLKNTTFHGILLDELMTASHTDKTKLKQLINKGIIDGAIWPLPNTVFGRHEAEQAFRFLAKGNNIGKVLLQIQNENNPTCKTVPAIRKSYMNPEKVYILIGGLGGFGLELSRWLIERSATKIILSSRKGVKSGYQALCLKNWKHNNINVHVSTIDASTAKGAKEILKEANTYGPVGGIFNLAAVLRDALLINQTEKDFEITCNPKINITKCLDMASRILTPYLDYFVVFSSIACGRGNTGQTNYGFANSGMERICAKRHNIGLPALAIQWGPIGDVGLVVESMNGITDIMGASLQNLSSCLFTMDTFLQQPYPVVSSLVLADKINHTRKNNQIKLTKAIANILGLANMTDIPGDYSLTDAGIDSIMTTVIKLTLERDYGLLFNLQEIGKLTFKKLLQFEKDLISIQKSVNNDIENKTTPLFILPAIEGAGNNIKDIALKIESSVYELEYSSTSLTSISELASCYINEIKQIQPEGPYRLIGYSFGAYVAFEIATKLEENTEEVNLLLINGSSEYFRSSSRMVRSEKNVSADIESEYTEFMLFYAQKFTGINCDQLSEELSAMESWDKQVKRVAEFISSFTSHLPYEVESYLNSIYKRRLAVDTYKPTAIFNGKVMLLAVADDDVEMDRECKLNAFCKETITFKNDCSGSMIGNASLVDIIHSFFSI